MIKVITHWVEIRHYEFPNDCPLDFEKAEEYMLNLNNLDSHQVKEDSRDYEIVDIERVPDFDPAVNDSIKDMEEENKAFPKD